MRGNPLRNLLHDFFRGDWRFQNHEGFRDLASVGLNVNEAQDSQEQLAVWLGQSTQGRANLEQGVGNTFLLASRSTDLSQVINRFKVVT